MMGKEHQSGYKTKDEERGSKTSLQKQVDALERKARERVLPSYANELLRDCVEVRCKADCFQNRNKELQKEIRALRAEIGGLREKGEQGKDARRAFKAIEREVRNRQSEMHEMRERLVAMTTRNARLSEQLSGMRESAGRLADKSGDETILLDALTSQKEKLQQLLSRHQLLSASDARRFQEELRQLQLKHERHLERTNEMHEEMAEDNRLIDELAECDMVGVENKGHEEKKIPPSEKTDSKEEGSRKSENGKEGGNDEQKLKQLLDTSLDKLDRLSEAVVDNNKKLIEWQGNLLHTKAVSLQACAELQALKAVWKDLQLQAKKSKSAPNKSDDTSSDEESKIMMELLSSEHQFLLSAWHLVAGSGETILRATFTSADQWKKIFLDEMEQMPEDGESVISDTDDQTTNDEP